jgi:hypothetical protein
MTQPSFRGYGEEMLLPVAFNAQKKKLFLFYEYEITYVTLVILEFLVVTVIFFFFVQVLNL